MTVGVACQTAGMRLSGVFGPPGSWPVQDLVAISEEFDAALVAEAYRAGVFPMPLHNALPPDAMGWWSPVHRGILPIDDLRVTRSLRKSVRRYALTVDAAFDAVTAWDVLEHVQADHEVERLAGKGKRAQRGVRAHRDVLEVEGDGGVGVSQARGRGLDGPDGRDLQEPGPGSHRTPTPQEQLHGTVALARAALRAHPVGLAGP